MCSHTNCIVITKAFQKTMIAIFMLVAIGQYAAAQNTYDCQCGFFVEEQVPGQIGEASPIPFRLSTNQVSPDVCLEQTEGNNTCQWICDQWGRGQVEEGWSLCDAPLEDGIERCYGGLYCEGLFQDQRIPEGGIEASMRTWYRIPQCPEASGYNEWNLGAFEHPEALCCNDFGFYDSCYDDCTDCIKAADPLSYCECGVFTTIQFFADDSDEYDPLPFKMNTSSVGDTPFSFCDNYVADSPTEECEIYCNSFGDQYFASYSLLDSASATYSVNDDITYGQLYCNSLRSRRVFLDQYINTEIRMYKRAPFCVNGPANAVWATMFPQNDHPERLCCTEDGEFEFPCYPPTA